MPLAETVKNEKKKEKTQIIVKHAHTMYFQLMLLMMEAMITAN